MRALLLLLVVTAVVISMTIYTVACLIVRFAITVALCAFGTVARHGDAMAVRFGLVDGRS